ncbi:MAG: hypothetical protein HY077_04725 [Elusimicrobia bacterium]|nr:hypothetical protein [Elusimicrobiota bacterium]
MNEPAFTLAPPPREVPLSVFIQELLGDFLTQFGFIFIGFGMVFVWIFVAQADFRAWYDFRGPLETAEGRLVSCQRTNFSENNTAVYALSYVFPGPGGVQRSGTSYRLGGCPPAESSAGVEWPAGRSERSRIKGLRTSVMPSFVAFVLIFPLVGLVCAFFGLRSGLKDVALLARGKLASGKLVEKKPTNTKINDRTVYEMVFSFVDDHGLERRASTKTHMPELLEDQERENLLYDPQNPSRMATLDTLPGLIRTGPGGTLEAGNPAKAIGALLLPALTVLGHGAYCFLRYFR